MVLNKSLPPPPLPPPLSSWVRAPVVLGVVPPLEASKARLHTDIVFAVYIQELLAFWRLQKRVHVGRQKLRHLLA